MRAVPHLAAFACPAAASKASAPKAVRARSAMDANPFTELPSGDRLRGPGRAAERWRRGTSLAHELVSGSVDGKDDPGAFGILLEDFPELHDMMVHGPALDIPFDAPDLLKKFLPGDHLVPLFPEKLHDHGLFVAELDRLAAHHGLEGLEIDGGVAEGRFFEGLFLREPGAAPEQGADPGHQDVEIEGL